ncbi:MAG: glycosyltransferase family 2 protein [Nanoarchaeota archaeon]
MDVSIVIPAYNEQENVKELYSKVSKTMKTLGKKYELIFIDDGSSDNTFEELLKLSKTDKNLRVIKFRRNFGQTAAWDAGFKQAKGKVVVTMDADLQNDPEDIPRLIKKLDEGYDAVSGWRYKRKDNFSKRIFSSFSRLLRRLIIKDDIHDSGCSLKAYKKDCLEGLDMQGEMHRYIAQLLILKGYKVGEMKVNHLARKKGKTKYGLLRLPKGFLDLIVVAFWQRYASRPIHLFGGAGILSSLLGIITGSYLVFRKFYYSEPIADRPLLMLSVLLVIIGIQFIIFGLIADILTKTYYSGKKHYSIEKKI